MSRALILVPVILSAVVLGAHILRWGPPWLALAVAALPLLLLAGRRWAVTTVQIALAMGALEWTRTLVALVGARRELGSPYTRLALGVHGQSTSRRSWICGSAPLLAPSSHA